MADLIDSYAESNYTTPHTFPTSTVRERGVSFSNSSAHNLSSCKFYLDKVGTITGTMVAKLYAHSGTYGSSSVPTGSVLATSDSVNMSVLTTSMALVEFIFSTTYAMEASTYYTVLLVPSYTSSNDASNCVRLGMDATPEHEGNLLWINNDTSVGYNASYDYCFYVYGNAAITFIPQIIFS